MVLKAEVRLNTWFSTQQEWLHITVFQQETWERYMPWELKQNNQKIVFFFSV